MSNAQPTSAPALDDTGLIADWQLLARFAQAYRSLADANMEQIDMHRAQATSLCRLYNNDGMTQSEIAQQLSVQGATVTDMLQRMEEAGLVSRRRDDDDNRVVRVYLTEQGRRKERAIVQQFTKMETAIFEGFSERERAALRTLVGRLLQNIRANE